MKHIITTTALLLLSYGSSIAQIELSLNDAVQHALKYKAESQKADLDIENADYKIQEIRANVLPHINASGGLTYNAKLQQMALDFGGQTQVIKMGTPWQSNAAIQLDQQIFNMSVFQGLKAAKSTREFYKLNANLTKEEVIEKVANSYYQVYKTKAQIETLLQTIKNTTRVKDAISGLESNGLAKKIDLDRMSVSLSNLISSKIQLDNALKLQENALKYLIGMNINASISFPDNSFEVNTDILHDDEFDINNRTEIKLLEKQGTLLKLNKSSIESSRYPSLAMSANYGYISMGNRFPYFAGQARGVNGSDFSAIALNLRVPLFSGFSTRAKIRQAEMEIRKYNIDLNDTKLALILATENAKTQIKNALINLNNQSSNKDLAKQVLNNIENNYKNGLASLTDLLDAENANANAQNNYTAAVLDYKLAEVQLNKAKGNLDKYSNNN